MSEEPTSIIHLVYDPGQERLGIQVFNAVPERALLMVQQALNKLTKDLLDARISGNGTELPDKIGVNP